MNSFDAENVAAMCRAAVDSIASSSPEVVNFVIVDASGDRVDASPMFELLGERYRHVELVLGSFVANGETKTGLNVLLDVEIRFMGARWAHQPEGRLEMTIDDRMASPEHFALSLSSACALIKTFHDTGRPCVLERH